MFFIRKLIWIGMGLFRQDERTVPVSSEEISFIHDRMPLMLREKDVDEWISPDAKPEKIASRAVTDLHFEKAPIEKPIEDEYTTFLPTPIGME